MNASDTDDSIVFDPPTLTLELPPRLWLGFPWPMAVTLTNHTPRSA